MTDKSAIIVKPSTAQAFETLWKRGRVLFFSAPCGFGKTVLADTLLDGRPVLRLNAADTGFALPSLEDAWDILLIDNIQDMQEERDWQARCALIRESTDRRFVLLSRGIPPACLMAFQYQKRDEAWREPLTAALALAEEYRLIRTVSVYGAAVLPLLETLDWDGNKAWRKRLMAAVRTQAAFYPHFLEPRLAPGEELTPTELQILHLLCADKSNAEIGEILGIRVSTVKSHVSSVLSKLGVNRRSEARTAAKKLWLISEDQ